MKKFNIEEQWRLYLQRMGLELGNMPLDQITECFRAFLGGIAQLYMFIYADLQKMTEEEATAALADVESQVTELLQKQAEYERLESQLPDSFLNEILNMN